MKVAKKKKGKNNIPTEQYQGYMSNVLNGEVTIFDTEKFVDSALSGYTCNEIILNLAKATSWDNKGGMKPAQKLRTYDKYVPALIRMYFAQQEIVNAFMKENARVTENTLERNGKKWDKDEDELLIEMAADESHSLMQIAIAMGRTPSAIQTRISYLVGIKKITKEIAGRFIGTLNGQSVNGYIEGSISV